MVKLFTHIDYDGIGCAVLAKIAFGDNVDIEFCDYNDVDKKVNAFINSEDDRCRGIEDDNYVFITDISVNESTAMNILNDMFADQERNMYYTLLDHHKTALQLNSFQWANVWLYNPETGIKTSGTEMFYMDLANHYGLARTDALEKFVENVRDYDTWRWAELGEEGLNSKNMNSLLYIYGRDKFIDMCVEKIEKGEFPAFSEMDKVLLDAEQRKIDKAVKTKNASMKRTELFGYKCGVVYADSYISEIGNLLCSQNKDLDIVAIINNDYKSVSLRTIRTDIDLGTEIAAQFGGGGHPQAAAFRFDDEILENFNNNIFEGKSLERDEKEI